MNRQGDREFEALSEYLFTSISSELHSNNNLKETKKVATSSTCRSAMSSCTRIIYK